MAIPATILELVAQAEAAKNPQEADSDCVQEDFVEYYWWVCLRPLVHYANRIQPANPNDNAEDLARHLRPQLPGPLDLRDQETALSS